jgi:prefoldin subunit 5
MNKKSILELAEGLRLIEEGVEKIQRSMRELNAKSIQEVAERLIPIFKEDDDSLTDSIIKHIG